MTRNDKKAFSYNLICLKTDLKPKRSCDQVVNKSLNEQSFDEANF